MSKKHKKRIQEMTEEINPDELMPLPERLKSKELVESPVEAQDEAERSLESKKQEIVEPVSTKVNLYRR